MFQTTPTVVQIFVQTQNKYINQILLFPNPNPNPKQSLPPFLPMSGRSRVLPHVLHHQAAPIVLRHPHPASIVAVLEDRISAHRREVQTLLADNQRLAATHVALTQDLAASRRDLRLAADAAARTKSERAAQAREVHERCVRMEDQVRAAEAMKLDLVQVRSDVEKLGRIRGELQEKAKELKAELARVKGDTGRTEEVKAEIEIVRMEIERGRAAIKHEQRAHADNLERSQAMEKNIVSLAREVEKLRAELTNAEKRARAAAAAAAAVKPVKGYAESYGNSEMAYEGNTYADAYNLHQLQRVVNSSQYGSAAVFRSPLDTQQSHAFS